MIVKATGISKPIMQHTVWVHNTLGIINTLTDMTVGCDNGILLTQLKRRLKIRRDFEHSLAKIMNQLRKRINEGQSQKNTTKLFYSGR